MDNIYFELAEIFEVEQVNDEDILGEFDCWDSLTSLSIIALMNETYKVTLTNKEVADSKTIGGLIYLLKNKLP